VTGDASRQSAVAYPVTSNAFRPCDACDGRGFLRAGDFANRSFPRCKSCDGIGQIYLSSRPVERDLAEF
jgi:hypothetical protein